MVHNASSKPTILVVEDKDADARGIELCLQNHFHIERAISCADTLAKLPVVNPALIVLDIILGDDLDAGYKICRIIRNGGEMGSLTAFKKIPIVMLSERSNDDDIDEGFRRKTTIYIAKPFKRAMLVGHIRELLGDTINHSLPSFAHIRLDLIHKTAWVDGYELARLRDQEFALLHELVKAQGEIVPDRELHRAIVGGDYRPNTKGQYPNNVRMLVSQVRNKLEQVHPKYWKIINRGRGGVLVEGEYESEPGYHLVMLPTTARP